MFNSNLVTIWMCDDCDFSELKNSLSVSFRILRMERGYRRSLVSRRLVAHSSHSVEDSYAFDLIPNCCCHSYSSTASIERGDLQF